MRYPCDGTDASADRRSLAQDGWRVVRRPDGSITREPVMREYTARWNAVPCGHLERATDDACGDCRHRLTAMRSDQA